jgi:hypothetical protein
MSRRTVSTALFFAATLFGGSAYADLSRGVISTFRGQFVVSKAELPEGKTDKDTVTKIKSAQLKEVTGTASDDVTAWSFHYTAFLTKTGSSSLKVEFYTDDKDKKYVANQSLSGVDPKNAVLSGDISINEDEGLTKGKAYVIKLENEKNQVVAETRVVFK